MGLTGLWLHHFLHLRVLEWKSNKKKSARIKNPCAKVSFVENATSSSSSGNARMCFTQVSTIVKLFDDWLAFP